MRFFLFLTLISISNVNCSQDLKVLQDFDTWVDFFKANSANVSETCSKQWKELLEYGRDAAWNIFDASSKFPWSGLSVRTIVDWGNYEQCINVNHPSPVGNIRGKYCPFGLMLPIKGVYFLSVCMPSGCTNKDYNSVIKIPLFTYSPCHTQEDLNKIEPGDTSFFAFIGVILTIIAVSTAYDVFLKYTDKKCSHPIFVAFSLYTNAKRLFQTSRSNQKEQIQIFQGMKTVSIVWIAAAHTLQGWAILVVTDYGNILKATTSLQLFYLTSARLGVDTFFYIGGFLVAFTYVKQKARPAGEQIKGLPLIILHRYLRLTPANGMLFFFYITVFRLTGSGPYWLSILKLLKNNCVNHYWSFFTYTQNYVNPNEICIVPTWYLSVDMQLFIFSILFLIPLTVLLSKKEENLSLVMWICCGCNVFFTFLPIVTKLGWDSYKNDNETHSQAISYTIGLTMGIFMRERKNKPFFNNRLKHPRLVNFLIWTNALVLMFAISVVYHEYNYRPNHDYSEKIIYNSVYKPFWCICLSWMVYSCYHGYGGFITWLLNRPLMQILGKLSYCLYLVHILPILHGTFSTRTILQESQYANFILWSGYLMVAIPMALLWSLAFESPMITIEKYMLGGGGGAKKPKQEPNNTDKLTA